MDPALSQAIGFAAFIAVCLLMGFFGTDSRAGFDGTPSSYKERWFIHSRRG